MKLTLLSTFLAVIDSGNLSRASEHLNVSQSTVTARIDALELEVGQKLLLRHKGGAELTTAGHKFVRHARSMLTLWRQTKRDIALPRGYSDVCSLACTDILWEGGGEVIVELIRSAEPTIAIEVVCGSDSDTAQRLSSGTADIALLYEPPRSEVAVVEAVFEDAFMQFATVARDVLRWDPSYVYVDLGERFRLFHADAYPVEESATVTFNNPVHALTHILLKGGSAYMPYRLVQAMDALGRVHEVKGAPHFRQQVWMGVQRQRLSVWPWITPMLEELTRQIKSVS